MEEDLHAKAALYRSRAARATSLREREILMAIAADSAAVAASFSQRAGMRAMPTPRPSRAQPAPTNLPLTLGYRADHGRFNSCSYGGLR